jgi:prepilin-type N-terminal cleavage/methylation domain-containing protein
MRHRVRPAPKAVGGRGVHGRRLGAFTLVELIAVMAIMSIVGLTIGYVMPTAVIGFRDSTTRAQLLEEASTTLERLALELRAIPLDATAPSSVAPDISGVTPTSIDWDTDWSLELIGANLVLTEAGGASAVLQPNVSSFSIACYDESDAALAASLSGSACDPIRRIQIELTLTRDGISQSLRTRIFLRACAAGAGV